MPKKFIKKYLPEPHHLKEHKQLKIFGKLLHDHDLWNLKRIPVIRAVSIGLFCAFIPLPFQMLLAAALAIVLSANLPISIVLVWISNPITMPPIFYFVYKVGTIITLASPKPIADYSLSGLLDILTDIWPPLLVGGLVCGVFVAMIGNVSMRVLWRISIVRRWQSRKTHLNKKS